MKSALIITSLLSIASLLSSMPPHSDAAPPPQYDLLIKNGRVPTPGIGIVAASEAVSTRLGIEGVIIVRTAPGSPAERAGIRGVDFSSGALGDVIVQADGKPVHRLSDLTDQIEQVGAGKSIRISLKRGSQTRDINIDIVDIGRG